MPILKTHSFFTLGLVAHIAALLFVSLYAVIGEAGPLLSSPQPAFNGHHPSSFHNQRHPGGPHIDGGGNETVFSSISIVTIIILYISFTMELTWPMRVEETLIIILLWSLLGNLGANYFVDQSLGCDGIGDDAATFGAHATDDTFQAETHQHQQHHPKETPVDADESPPPPPSAEDIDVDTDDEAIIIVKPHVTSPVAAQHVPGFARTHCSWNMFGVYFSLLCIFSSLLSLLCDVKNYYLSVVFKTLSIVITVLIFVVPFACNRFRLMSIEVLILKITLYNIVWNMNRFKRVTEDLIGDNYKKGVEIIQQYQTIYQRIETAVPSPISRPRGPLSNSNNNRQMSPYRQQRPRTASPHHQRRDYAFVVDGEQGEELDENRGRSRHPGYDEESDSDGRYMSRAEQKKRRLLHESLNTSNPSALFQLVDTINTNLEPVRRRISHRSHSAGGGDRRGEPHPSSSPPHLQQQQHHRKRLLTADEQVAPDQLFNFDALHRTSRRYGASWFFSWKNRYYGERIVYLFDIASTIWILAICPIFLFTVIIFLFWLAYYIRQNMHELEDTNKHIAVMNKLANNSNKSSGSGSIINSPSVNDDWSEGDDYTHHHHSRNHYAGGGY